MVTESKDMLPDAEAISWLPVVPEQHALAAPGDDKRLDLWDLVLQARGVPHLWVAAADGPRLLAPPERVAEAAAEIRLFEEENHNWPPVDLPAPRKDVSLLPVLSVLFLLAGFHNLTTIDGTLFGFVLPDWTAAGSADAGRIMQGEWWRLVTSLTLHADYAHLAGNLAIGGFLVAAVCRETGAGAGFPLLLASGVLGNLANAIFQPPAHNSIGASTLVFGAVGILALLRPQAPFRRRVATAGAAVALLALLGTEGVRTDLGAHLFGFVAGLLLAVPARFATTGRRSGRVGGIIAGWSAAAFVAASWWMALAWR